MSEPVINVDEAILGLSQVTDEYLTRHRGELLGAVAAGLGGIEAAQRHASIMDGLLGALYCGAHAAAGSPGASSGNRVALVGVGGVGRGLVGLHSDIDLLLLCDDPADPRVQQLASTMLYPLWDAGVEVGHVVRGVDETIALAREDSRTTTTLVDLRRITGDETIVRELRRKARRRIFEPGLVGFLDELEKDARERHRRYGESLYLLEPEVKLGRGGLRDADVGRWAARARWRVTSFTELTRCGALLPREAHELRGAREALWQVRNLLHLSAGRRHDRLTFSDQEEIALKLGFKDGVQLAVEQFMQSYYRHARVIAQTSERLVARARPEVRRARAHTQDLGAGLLLFDGKVTFIDSGRLAVEPLLALRLYEKVLSEGRGAYPFARDAVYRAAQDAVWVERLRKTPEAPRLFFKLLTHAARSVLPGDSILKELHEVGLLVGMIPEFASTVGRVQHDIYNVYTVDVHSLRTVDALRRIERGDEAGRWPTVSRIAAEAPRPEPVYLACLVHEIGKGRGPNPTEIGADLTFSIGKRLGFTDVDAEHAAFLVRNQISLYRTATQRDLNDPNVLAEVASLTGTVERLRDLYLLTFVDLCATNPKAMTVWKARLLEELGNAVARVIDGEEPDHSQGRVRAIRREVAIAFVGQPAQVALEAFLEDMPARYILANPVEVIREHAQAAMGRGEQALIVRDVSLSGAGLAELIVVADDRPGLLAEVAATLARHRLSVLGAQIYTRGSGTGNPEAVDIFQVRPSDGGDAVLPATLRAIERDLAALREGRIEVVALLDQAQHSRWAVRDGPDVNTEVIIDNEAAPTATIIDVYTRDRPGLLCEIAQTIREAGVLISFSRINTEGLRVADVFYVTDEGGHKIRDKERLVALRTGLVDMLSRPRLRKESG